ncbi:hypothetical protein JJB99_31500 [Bradyrhizobium diazoefficiens]|nr:hypothetical protein [Bradyrhizobium diazoefficiens]QQO13843.1 hypothetical protein JJB99_31500 [Bradyrhizobium diazoefficiens]
MMIDTAPCKPQVKSSRDQTPKDTCDNERVKFNHQFDAIAIAVATIEWR